MPINIAQDEFTYSIDVEFEVSVGSDSSVCGKLDEEKQTPYTQQDHPGKGQQYILVESGKRCHPSGVEYGDIMKVHAKKNIGLGSIIDSLEVTLPILTIPMTEASDINDHNEGLCTQNITANAAYFGCDAKLIESLYILEASLLVALFEDGFVCQHYTETRQPVHGYAQPYDDTARYFLETLDDGNVPEGLQEMIHCSNHKGFIILEIWDYRQCKSFKCPSCSLDLPTALLEFVPAAKMWRRFLKVEQENDFVRWNAVFPPESSMNSKQDIISKWMDYKDSGDDVPSADGDYPMLSTDVLTQKNTVAGAFGEENRTEIVYAEISDHFCSSVYTTPSQKKIRNKDRSTPKGPKSWSGTLQTRREIGGMQHLATQLGAADLRPADLIREGQGRQCYIQIARLSSDDGLNMV
uniref:Uncharacterized protein AlNc14C9G1174 n=1 Tax=Albugo laibachii Nc14 TaxID=890382 RepID=F0W2C4_9STRA|nr:hypothetical protein PITG_02451 [Albugo laibachii Nc14]|eukprot:CCA15209.1 hypothetical protein PITG_02451 [Albugo laibachii Nc14]